MFRFLKYLFVMNRLRHAKNALVFLIACAIFLVLFLFFFSDITKHINPESLIYWMMFKWTIVIAVLAFMGFSAKRVLTLFTQPFGKDQVSVDQRKNVLTAKPTLMSKRERILQKYKTNAL
jgi:hypothetical protein